MSGRWKLVGAGAVVYVAVVWCFGLQMRPTPAHAADDKKEEKKAKADAGTKAKPIYFGVISCTDAGCHAAPEDKPLVQKPPLVCRYNEGTLWKKYDKHGLAYEVIDTSDDKNKLAGRARRMEKILAATKKDKDYKVYKDPDCLACHALKVDPKVEKAEGFNIKEGVNCVVCHGAYQEWVVEHSAPLLRKKYRVMDREVKWHDKGMIDLWDPVK